MVSTISIIKSCKCKARPEPGLAFFIQDIMMIDRKKQYRSGPADAGFAAVFCFGIMRL